MPKYYYLQLIRKRLAWIRMYEKVTSAVFLLTVKAVRSTEEIGWVRKWMKTA
ncbi:MAG TPA: hypothetical protein ACFYD3_05840 [Candidatus Hypogeohydataceae bacterium YC41]